MVIDWVAPVAWSFAETCTMPLASMSKVTSIWGMPRGAGGNADELELTERLVVGRHLTLTLEYVNLDEGLIVVGRREGLGTSS